MTTREEVLEYIEKLKANYAERKKDTYKDIEITRNWLFLERMAIIDSYNVDDLTEEQFMFIDNVFDELINDNITKSKKKLNKTSGSTQNNSKEEEK